MKCRKNKTEFVRETCDFQYPGGFFKCWELPKKFTKNAKKNSDKSAERDAKKICNFPVKSKNWRGK